MRAAAAAVQSLREVMCVVHVPAVCRTYCASATARKHEKHETAKSCTLLRAGVHLQAATRGAAVCL